MVVGSVWICFPLFDEESIVWLPLDLASLVEPTKQGTLVLGMDTSPGSLHADVLQQNKSPWRPAKVTCQYRYTKYIHISTCLAKNLLLNDGYTSICQLCILTFKRDKAERRRI